MVREGKDGGGGIGIEEPRSSTNEINVVQMISSITVFCDLFFSRIGS